jgi:hypothetical protein
MLRIALPADRKSAQCIDMEEYYIIVSTCRVLIHLVRLAKLIPVEGFPQSLLTHVPRPGRGIVRRSVECHVSLGNHPVKLEDQQHQTGLDQILRRTVGMIARSSTKQFNIGKCRVFG